MKTKEIVIIKDCKGSENGITVKEFVAGPDVIEVEEKLANVFISQKWATLPTVKTGKPGPTEKKIVTPEVKADDKEEIEDKFFNKKKN